MEPLHAGNHLKKTKALHKQLTHGNKAELKFPLLNQDLIKDFKKFQDLLVELKEKHEILEYKMNLSIIQQQQLISDCVQQLQLIRDTGVRSTDSAESDQDTDAESQNG